MHRINNIQSEKIQVLQKHCEEAAGRLKLVAEQSEACRRYLTALEEELGVTYLKELEETLSSVMIGQYEK